MRVTPHETIHDVSTVLDVVRGQLSADVLLGWTHDVWTAALRDLPRDGLDFLGRFELSWQDAISTIAEWRETLPDEERRSKLRGYLGLLILTLVSLRHSQWHRQLRSRYSERSANTDHECSTICEPLLNEASVRNAIHAVYRPDPAEGNRARADWDRIDFESLQFYRHGTTSFLLRGLPAEAAHGRRPPLALKCIIQPYLRVPVIVRSTREYAALYGTADYESRHLVRVWASSASWILMDFVAGQTLGEYLEAVTRGQELRLDLLSELGHALFAAMAELERLGLSHGDLSPANIILHQEAGSHRFVLVDLGTNYLYTQTVPGLEGPDAIFVAPEVRAGEIADRRTDLYSLGQLLIATAGAKAVTGSVPDLLYAETTIMARFIEDLVDDNPRHRLLVYRPDPRLPLFPQLERSFTDELEAVSAAQVSGKIRWIPQWLNRVIDMFRPLAGAPGRQRRIWQIRSKQPHFRDSRRGMHTRWLLAWSWISATVWYVGAAIVATWWLRDAQWDWGNQAITLLQRLTRTPADEFPFLDKYREYPIPDLVGNLPVRITAISFLLIGARYYQNLFSGLTPMVTGPRQGRLSLQALAAEMAMRCAAIQGFVLILPPTLIQRDWWIVYTTIGIVLTTLVNLACLTFARSALKCASQQRLSIAPEGRMSSLETFAYWTPSSAFYAMALVGLILMIHFGLAGDIFVYATGIAANNIILFYMIKCSGSSAATVRVALGRACLAAERLRYLQEPLADDPSEARHDIPAQDGEPATVL